MRSRLRYLVIVLAALTVQLSAQTTETENLDYCRLQTADTSPAGAAGSLSKDFRVHAVQASASLSRWREHIRFALRNGYPPPEALLLIDQDHADQDINIAKLYATNKADCGALLQLQFQLEALQGWSSDLLESYKQLRLARLYMSRDSVEEDANYRKIRICGEQLSLQLASGVVQEIANCSQH